MDRIWGGFMDEIKEEGEDGKVPEPETPETKARRALNEKTKKRRRRRARNQMAPSAVKTTSKISKNYRFSLLWLNSILNEIVQFRPKYPKFLKL